MDGAEEGTHGDNLTAVMESMGIYDTDLRARTHDNARTNASAVNETQRLLKILLATLNKAVHQGSLPTPSHQGEPSGPAALDSEPESRHRNELTSHTNYAEVRLFTIAVRGEISETQLGGSIPVLGTHALQPGTAAAQRMLVRGALAINSAYNLSQYITFKDTQEHRTRVNSP